MKLVHLSDLHIGKRINEFNMLEDQEYILKQILTIADEENPDSVMIAGDIYDKSIPSAEAVQLFDDFLVDLTNRNVKVFVISGNHDSPERIAFGSRLIDQSGVYLSPVYNGIIKPIPMQDKHGTVDVFMLPFIKPAHVKRYYPNARIESFTEALQTAIDNMKLNPQNRNVLITHQFVTGASRCESEDLSIGGADNVDALVFEPFDYVALGHIHSPQKVLIEKVRYCGTPLKYSFSEANQTKSVTVIELGQKGELTVRAHPLKPKRDMREIRGSYMEICAKSFYEGKNNDDYLHITLTDEEDIPDAIGKLRVIYPNIMKLDYDNKRTKFDSTISGTDSIEQKSPYELFFEFYEKQNNRVMTGEQQAFIEDLIERIWEGEK